MDKNLKNTFAKSIQNVEMMGDSRYSEQEITDIPVMYMEDGTIVCLKDRDEVSSIAITGESGNGKTLILHEIVDHIWNLWGSNVCVMNDWQSETLCWSESQDVPKFVKTLYKIQTKPKPLPMVYIFPMTNTLNQFFDDDVMFNKDYVKITLPLKELLNDLPYYFNSICPEFVLGGSTIYAENLYDEFIKCETPEDFYDVIDREINMGKASDSIKNKLKNAFKKVFDEKLLKITAPGCASYLKIEEFVGNPLSAIMYANGIPSLIVSDLKKKKYRNAVLAYHINSVFANQQHPAFRGKKLYMVFDELTTICSTTDRENNPAKTAIIDVVARGRINDIGIIYATQLYEKIPPEIKQGKMTYLFSFRTPSKKTRMVIAHDFGFPEEVISKMGKLRPFECFAATTDKFVLYKDGRRWEVGGLLKGRIFFPISRHKWIV